MDFLLLGPLEVWRSGERLSLGPRRAERCLLGLLLLEPDRILDAERLADLLWDGDPPDNGLSSIRSHVSRLRSRLDPHRDGRFGIQLLAHGSGYLARVNAGQVDTTRFREMVVEAEKAADPGSRSMLLRDALSLWRGPLLEDVASDRLRDRIAGSLDELRLHAWEACMAAELECGRHSRIITELMTLTESFPLREGLTASLMLALYRSGRQAAALEAFRQASAYAIDAIGLDAGPELQRLHERILRADPVLDTPTRDRLSMQPSVGWRLPTPLSDFVGRTAVAERVSNHYRDCRERGFAAIVAISGLPGVGKTALAVVAAHRLRGEFPAGQLYADLRGHAEPLSAHVVLDRFLRELGVEIEQIPEEFEEKVSLYRDLLSQAPRLVLLDNVASVAQIQPLLPVLECPLFVTSRTFLADLDGACFVQAEPLLPDESLALLSSVIGRQRVMRDHRHALQIVEHCGGLPLAMRISAVRCLGPDTGLEVVAQELADAVGRLDHLNSAERSVRASLQSSHDYFHQKERDLLRGLATTSNESFPEWLACAVLDCSPSEAQTTLERLVQASFVDLLGPDDLGQARYRLHDLVRAFAAEPGLDAEVLRKVADAWNTLACQADSLINSNTPRFADASPSRPAATEVHQGDPQGWFTVEIGSILDMATMAADAALGHYAWSLNWHSEPFLRTEARTKDMLVHCRRGLAAAEHADDMLGIACMSLSIAAGYLIEDDLHNARIHADRGLKAAEAAEQTWLRADLLGVIAQIHGSHGDTGSQSEVLLEAIELYRQAGDLTSAGVKLTSLGEIAEWANDAAAARVHYETGIAYLREAGAQVPLAMGLRRLAKSHREAGDLRRAIELYRECLHLVEESNELVGQLCLHTDLALTFVDLDEPQPAQDHTDKALLLGEQVKHPLYLSFARMGQAVLQAHAGDLASALATLTNIADQMQAVPYWRMTCMFHTGRLQRELGDTTAAHMAFTEAAVIADRLGIVAAADQARRELQHG